MKSQWRTILKTKEAHHSDMLLLCFIAQVLTSKTETRAGPKACPASLSSGQAPVPGRTCGSSFEQTKNEARKSLHSCRPNT